MASLPDVKIKLSEDTIRVMEDFAASIKRILGKQEGPFEIDDDPAGSHTVHVAEGLDLWLSDKRFKHIQSLYGKVSFFADHVRDLLRITARPQYDEDEVEEAADMLVEHDEQITHLKQRAADQDRKINVLEYRLAALESQTPLN